MDSFKEVNNNGGMAPKTANEPPAANGQDRPAKPKTVKSNTAAASHRTFEENETNHEVSYQNTYIFVDYIIYT